MRLLTHVCVKHIFNLHHDRQDRDKCRLRRLNDFEPVGFDWEVAAASAELGAALRLMLLSLMNCFLLASNGSPWPVVPLPLDLGQSFNAFKLWWLCLEDEPWLVGLRRIVTFFQRSQKLFICLLRSGRIPNNLRTLTKITAVKQHSCQQPAMWLPSYIPNKTDGVKCTKTIECSFGFPGTLHWEETML